MISREHLAARLEGLQASHEQVVLLLQQHVGAITELTRLLGECEEPAEVPQAEQEQQ